jgi:hypothetical protein
MRSWLFGVNESTGPTRSQELSGCMSNATMSSEK